MRMRGKSGLYSKATKRYSSDLQGLYLNLRGGKWAKLYIIANPPTID
jgi:hypothetical protein